MPVQEIRKFKTVLPNGREILVSTTEAQIVLQVRQLPLREDDLLGPVIHVAAALTAAECVALASELLRAAAPLLEQAAAEHGSLFSARLFWSISLHNVYVVTMHLGPMCLQLEDMAYEYKKRTHFSPLIRANVSATR